MDKNSYALGMSIAHNMISSGIKSIEFEDFAAGVKALLNGEEPAISFQEAGQLLDKYFAELEAERKAEAEAMTDIAGYKEAYKSALYVFETTDGYVCCFNSSIESFDCGDKTISFQHSQCASTHNPSPPVV